MKRLPITLSLPEELFTQAYKEAAQDEEMNKESELWDQCIGDGLDKSNDD